MQTLGLFDSTPRTESRFKSLFWPTIRNSVDLETVTTQGFWICFLVAAPTFLLAMLPLLAGGKIRGPLLLDAVFFFLGGVGVRQRSRAAAIAVFGVYLLSTLLMLPHGGRGFLALILTAMLVPANGFLIVRIVWLLLLLANVRGIWLSAGWQKEEGDAPPASLNQNWRDKLSDRLPAFLWPKARILFYSSAIWELGGLLYFALYRLGLRPLG